MRLRTYIDFSSHSKLPPKLFDCLWRACISHLKSEPKTSAGVAGPMSGDKTSFWMWCVAYFDSGVGEKYWGADKEGEWVVGRDRDVILDFFRRLMIRMTSVERSHRTAAPVRTAKRRAKREREAAEMASGEVVTDEVIPDEMIPDEVVSDEVVRNEVVADEEVGGATGDLQLGGNDKDSDADMEPGNNVDYSLSQAILDSPIKAVPFAVNLHDNPFFLTIPHIETYSPPDIHAHPIFAPLDTPLALFLHFFSYIWSIPFTMDDVYTAEVIISISDLGEFILDFGDGREIAWLDIMKQALGKKVAVSVVFTEGLATDVGFF